MGKSATKKDEAKVFGLSGAAIYLGCAGRTVLRHANLGNLRCARDASGKRLFTLADLQKFTRLNRIGNQGRPVVSDDARQKVAS